MLTNLGYYAVLNRLGYRILVDEETGETGEPTILRSDFGDAFAFYNSDDEDFILVRYFYRNGDLLLDAALNRDSLDPDVIADFEANFLTRVFEDLVLFASKNDPEFKTKFLN